MKLYIASDLHVEFHKDKKQYIDSLFGDGDPESTVVLAGDIDCGRTNLKHTLAQIAEKFKYAVYVPGNHEYYNGLGYGELRKVVPDLPKNVFYLDQDTIILDNTIFIGATLWSCPTSYDYHLERDLMRFFPDFKRMKNNSVAAHRDRYFQDKAYLKLMALKQFPTEKKVIVTHFLPDDRCIHPRWLKEESQYNSYFASNVGFIEDLENATWIFGHTHDHRELSIGQTKLYCNPIGYPNERADKPTVLQVSI